MVLEKFCEVYHGKYRCQLRTGNGDPLLDATFSSDLPVSSQTLNILQIATNPSRGGRHIYNIVVEYTLANFSKFGYAAETSTRTITLSVKILALDAKNLRDGMGVSCDHLLRVCAPETTTRGTEPWSPRDFYDNVYVPLDMDVSPEFPAIDQLDCKLYPFQKRAVQWLLQREGASQRDELRQDNHGLPPGFIRTMDAEGKSCLTSRLLGMVTTDENVAFDIDNNLYGGILAEEMGLGKTVEMIALICLHKQASCENLRSRLPLPRCSATLIITPPAILDQWRTELSTLAPSLKVLIYEGLKAEVGKTNYEDLFSVQDVVLTTYNILGKEIHYAETVDRSLRHEKKYETKLSPLTHMVWWRVVLDEAQIVESVSNAAKVAKLIPREMAWCVSGTPVKKDVRDLFGLLDFLRYRPYCDLPVKIWDRLVTHDKEIFKHIFGTIALRHTKDQIKNEIRLPPQKRVVITVPFTQIEEQHYLTLFKEMSEECGLDLNGAPLTEDWDPESPVVIEKMRNWLIRLRQTCLHPEVGVKNRKALGNGKGPLRTVGEVLEVMIEQNETATRSEERTNLLSQIRRGQLLEHAELSEEALEVWLHTLEEATVIAQDCRDQLRAEMYRLGLTDDSLWAADVADAEGTTVARSGLYRQRLRAAIELEHMCTFFVANAYFQIKTDEEKTKLDSKEYHELERKEESTYEKAKLLRKELLKEARRKADALIVKISDRVESGSLVVVPRMPDPEDQAGIESRAYIDRLNTLVTKLEGQAEQINEWRKQTIKLLIMPLVDEVSAFPVPQLSSHIFEIV